MTRDGKDRAFASLTPERPSGLYNIDLDTGEADLIGNIGPKKGTKVTDIAIPIGQR